MAEFTEYYERRENQANHNEDEISLLDIYLVLVRRKKAIFMTFVAVVLLCVIYILFAPKVYQASVRLLPPAANDVVLTNLDGVKIKLSHGDVKNGMKDETIEVVPANTAKDVFASFKEKLQSTAAWNQFVARHPDWFTKEAKSTNENQTQNIRKNPIKFSEDKDFIGENLLVQYDSKSRNNVGPILAQYLTDTAKNYIVAKKQFVTQRINFYIRSLKSDISDSRALAKAQLADDINRLKDSLAIAKKLGITENRLVTIKNRQSLTVVTSDLKTPDYMRGTKVLLAELEQLQNRTSNDPYIPGLRVKQSALQRLQSFKFTDKTFQPLNIDGGVNQPVRVKPKRKLILALGIVFGLMLGVFAAFIAEFTQKARSIRK